jgi:trimeric autotransporter adhesin
MALGSSSTASGSAALALGNGANATQLGAMAMGSSAQATGGIATAIGYLTQATGTFSTGIGERVVASGLQATSVGGESIANATNATAVGYKASATFSGSTAVGANAATTRANQVKLGGTGASVAIGDIAASDAAQTGTEYYVTVDSNGTLGRGGQTGASLVQMQQSEAIGGLQAQQAVTDAQVNQLFDLSNYNIRQTRKANEGVAMALAMESPALPAGTSFALSGGIGYYNGRSAATTAVTQRIGRNSSLSAGVGVGLNTGEVGARGGFQVAW